MWYVFNKNNEMVAFYEKEKWAKDHAEAINGTYKNSKEFR